jgi:hypothetical protein
VKEMDVGCCHDKDMQERDEKMVPGESLNAGM